MHQTLTISELTRQIQSSLEDHLKPSYWVIGELTDFRVAGQGHAYFELVEKSENSILAKIRSTLWAFNYREISNRFEKITGSRLKSGMTVMANITVNFHPVYGLSANVKDIDASFSLGERERIRRETIQRLTSEKLINLNSQLSLPSVVQKVAIISSKTAAGYQDFVNQLDSNTSNYQIYHKLYQATLQGNTAATSIINALKKIKRESSSMEFDAVVLIRGGGAQLDLDCFDEYGLSREIALMELPVFTGIGHERDETVADLVAHTTLKTPTAVAEFILSSFREFEENIRISSRHIERLLLHQINLEQEKLVNTFREIEIFSSKRLQIALKKIEFIQREIELRAENLLQIKNLELTQLEQSLHDLSPISIMKRGYSRTEINGVPIDQKKIKKGDTIKTITPLRIIESEIKKIEANE